MSKYHIVCTELRPVTGTRPHQHIVAVGVRMDSNNGYATSKNTLAEVINNIGRGDTYYTIGSATGKVAIVKVTRCAHCAHDIIKTWPDDTRDDNLESMRTCQWG